MKSTVNDLDTYVYYKELLSLDITPNPDSYSRLFPILLDHSRLLQAYNVMSCDFLVMYPYLFLAID